VRTDRADSLPAYPGTSIRRNLLQSAAIRLDPSQQCHTAVAAMKGIGHFFAVSNRDK
jgi:hypothetical protein